MAAFFDLWHRLGNGTKALTIATAVEFEAVAAAEVAVLAASCQIGSSSPMAVVDVAVVADRSSAAHCLVGKGSATATHVDRWSET